MSLLNSLQSYLPYDANEAAYLQQVIAFLQQTAQPFHRETLAGHITGSAIVINPHHTHILLLHHRQLGRWLQPGGHCDGNPDPLAVAIKEVQEETGLMTTPTTEQIFDIDVHLIPAKAKVPAHWHYDIRYLLMADDRVLLEKSEREIIDLQWILIEQALEVAPEESFRRVQAKLAQLQATDTATQSRHLDANL